LKGNLYGRVPTLAYRIRAEHDAAVPWVEWEPEPVNVRLSEVFDPTHEASEVRSSRRQCEEWLREYMTEGPRRARDVEAAAKASGFSKDTLRRTREKVCDSVHTGQPGRDQGWEWILRPGET